MLPDHARWTPWTVPLRKPKPARPAASHVVASWPGRPSQLSRRWVPAVSGVRCRLRSAMWWPVMSSSSSAASGSGRTGVTSSTTIGARCCPPSASRSSRTQARRRSRPLGSRRSSVPRLRAWTSSTASEVMTSTVPAGPDSVRWAWVTWLGCGLKEVPSARCRSTPGREDQAWAGRGRTDRSLAIQAVLVPSEVRWARSTSSRAAEGRSPRSVPQWRTTGNRSGRRSRTTLVPPLRRWRVIIVLPKAPQCDALKIL